MFHCFTFTKHTVKRKWTSVSLWTDDSCVLSFCCQIKLIDTVHGLGRDSEDCRCLFSAPQTGQALGQQGVEEQVFLFKWFIYIFLIIF